jgi:hypothetical protein
LQQEVVMPGNAGGNSADGGCGSALVVGLLLLAGFGWLSWNSQTPPAAVQQPPSSSTSTPSAQTIGADVVNIVNTDPKVEGAIVRVIETPVSANTNQNVLTSPACAAGQHISVWAQGYFILTFQCIDNPALRYDVQLEAVPTAVPVMNETLGTISASNCAGCHYGSNRYINEYAEWTQDGHSQVFTDPYFRTTYLGTNISGQPSQQIQWNILPDGQKIYPLLDRIKPDYGAGYHIDYPVRNGNCAFCHIPASSPGTIQEMNIADLIKNYLGGYSNVATEGVTCDICHKVTDVLVEKNSKLPYDDRPGILSMSLLRPMANEQFNFGPLAYDSILGNPSKTTCFPIFSESKFCAACHYAKFANTLIYGSYKEWLDSGYSKPGTSSYRTCQDCHMTGEANIGNTPPTERAACSGTNRDLQNFNHNMMNYGQDPENASRKIPLLVKDAAQIRLEPVLTGGQIQIKVTVQSVGVGHKFPTDSPLRHLFLVIKAEDWRGNLLTQSGGPMIPVWAAPDYAGYAGQIFANILKDKDTNLAPSFAYWNPVETAWQGADTRLVPGVPVQSIYAFAAPYDRWARITARLIYRRAFKNVVDQKDWPKENLDIQVTQTIMDCTGFGADPQTVTCNPATATPTP